MNPRKTFQLFYSPDGAAGAGAGSATVDGTAAGDGKKVEDGVHGAGSTVGAVETPEQIAADKKTVDDAAAAEAAKVKTPPVGETPEQKTAREAKEKTDADAAAEAAKPKAPDKYELKVGKDAATFIDAEDLKQIEKVARDKGLTNDQAQAIVDGRASALLEQSVAFRAVTEADADLGGDKMADTQRLVKVAMDKIYPAGTKDGDDFRQMLAKTGYGNNRLIIKHFRDLGRQMAEDSPGAEGTGGGNRPKDAATVLYDHPTSKTEG